MALAPRKKLRNINLRSEEDLARQRRRERDPLASEEDLARQQRDSARQEFREGVREVKEAEERRLTADPRGGAQRRARRAAQAAGGSRWRSLLAGGAMSPLGLRRSLLGF